MQQEVDPKIIAKIQAILNLGKSSNQEEAAAALAKAQFFLAKHNLTLAQVQQADVEALYEPVEANIGHSRWRAMLLHVIAQHNFCHAVYQPKLGTSIVIGYKDNQEAVLAMYRCVEPQLITMASEEWQYKGQGNVLRWKDAWYLGVNTTIDQRLQESKERMLVQFEAPQPPEPHSEDVFIPRPEPEEEAAGKTGRVVNPMKALMVLNNAKLERSVKKHFPRLEQSKKKVKARSAFEHGLQAGYKVTLAGGLIEEQHHAGR